jgi:hypothetical protein
LKLMLGIVPLMCMVVLLFAGVPPAKAQSNFSVYGGGGTAIDKSTGQHLDICQTGNPLPTPSMGGAWGRFGADFMLLHHLGIGAAYSVHFTQTPYACLNYRPAFFDFNAIYEPFSSKRVVPEIEGGLGGMNIKYYIAQTQCLVSCTTYNTYLQSTNHFDLHVSGGIRFYVHNSIFIRPQVDVHYVPHLSEFGSKWVPEYSVAVGYTFGER